jgi:hypothetical protein
MGLRTNRRRYADFSSASGGANDLKPDFPAKLSC